MRWGRKATGLSIRLLSLFRLAKVKRIAPQYVRPVVKGQKNDAADAEAIVIAARQPEMRQIPARVTNASPEAAPLPESDPERRFLDWRTLSFAPIDRRLIVTDMLQAEERAWLDQLFGPMGWIDAFRAVNQNADEYTWWSNRGQAWAKNVGWRIDYQVVTPGLGDRVRAADIYTAERFSDHAPLTIDYDFEPGSADA